MALPLTAGTYAADSVHSSIAFSIRHLGLAKVRGSFTSFSADLTVGTGLSGTSIAAAIDLASVSTGNSDRDAHLQSGDFFNSELHPEMTFNSTNVVENGSGYTLTGDLTLNGVTAPISLDGEFHGTSTFPMNQSTRAGFSFSSTLSRKAYGMEFDAPAGADKLMLGDKVAVELDIQFIL